MYDLDIEDAPTGLSGTAPPLWLEVHGPIDRAMADRVTAELTTHAEARSLLISVDSSGGKAGPAFDIYAAIRKHRAAEKIAYISRAESAAVSVAIAADRRALMSGGTMLLHGVEIVPEGRWTAAKHEQAADSCHWSDAQIARLLAYRTATPVETFLAEMASENPATPNWLMVNGVTTEIKETT